MPVQLFVFDLLELDGTDTTGLPYTRRRELLDDLGLTNTLIRTPPYWSGMDPATLLELAADHGLEGIVSKRVDSIYRTGQRSRYWVKTVLRHQTDVVVAGWLPSSTSTRVFGSLILGAYEPGGRLVHVGSVGTGFSTALRRTLQTRLDDIASDSSPFDPAPRMAAARWVTPTLVGAVYYREFVGALRQPSWAGLRGDLDPRDVHLPALDA